MTLWRTTPSGFSPRLSAVLRIWWDGATARSSASSSPSSGTTWCRSWSWLEPTPTPPGLPQRPRRCSPA
jgi:hypothetical protein